MRLVRLLIAIVIGAVVLDAAAAGRAADRAADELLQRWADALRAAPQLAVHYHTVHINNVFGIQTRGRGECYRDGPNRWTVRMGPPAEEPVSALQPANGRQPVRQFDQPPFGLIGDADQVHIFSGEPPQAECRSIPLVSTRKAEDRPQGRWWWSFDDWSDVVRRLYRLSNAFPLFAPEDPLIGSYNIEVLRRSPEATWLRLTVDEPDGSSPRVIEAVFRANEDLPYALRVINQLGTEERRFVIQDLHRGDAAAIPVDAFIIPAAHRRPAADHPLRTTDR